jgi:hypothetical protein
MEKDFNLEKISRLEVINHAKNGLSIGRVITLYKELNDFDSIEISIQDDGRTMKIFINSNKETSHE